MDKSLKDRQKFREDFLQLMENHGISSATVQFVADGNGEYDDFVINDRSRRIEELDKLIVAQAASMSCMEQVFRSIASDEKYTSKK